MFLVFDVDWWTGFESRTEVESSSGLWHTKLFYLCLCVFQTREEHALASSDAREITSRTFSRSTPFQDTLRILSRDTSAWIRADEEMCGSQ